MAAESENLTHLPPDPESVSEEEIELSEVLDEDTSTPAPSDQEALASGARRVGGVVLTAVISLVWVLPVCVLAVLVQERSRSVLALDSWGSGWGARAREAGLGPLAQALTHIGDPVIVTLLSLVLAAALWVRGDRRASAYVLGCRAGAAILSSATKLVVGRERPTLEDPISSAFGASFPSGHTLGTAALVASVAGVLVLGHRVGVDRSGGRGGRVGLVVLLLLGALVVALVGATRVVLGVHYLSDVVGGVLMGVGWVVSASVGALVLTRRERAREGR